MSRPISIEIDPDEALSEIGEAYIREWLGDDMPSPGPYSVHDPVTRLGIITELRRLGYTVEP